MVSGLGGFNTLRNYTPLKHGCVVSDSHHCFNTLRNYTPLKLERQEVTGADVLTPFEITHLSNGYTILLGYSTRFNTLRNYTPLKHDTAANDELIGFNTLRNYTPLKPYHAIKAADNEF